MAAAFLPRGGSNPVYGRDPGPPPPRINQPYPYGLPNGIPFPIPGDFPAPLYYGTTTPIPPPPGFFPGGIYPTTPQPYHYTSGLHGHTAQTYPASDFIGEPGYNYFFPAEHTKIHVLECGQTPPWQLPELPPITNANTDIPCYAFHVPVTTTVTELMVGFGATNPNKKLNQMWEVVQGGVNANGKAKWYKGLHIGGEDKGILKKTIEELGWDSSRTGLPGGKPVVYLYLTRD